VTADQLSAPRPCRRARLAAVCQGKSVLECVQWYWTRSGRITFCVRDLDLLGS